MINSDQLIEAIYQTLGPDFLQKAESKDELANGAQILGNKQVSKIAFGVSLNEEFLHQAIDWGAQMVIFHHGFDVRTEKSMYPLHAQKRLRLIFQHNLNVLGFHYALDAHPTLGNNAQIIQKIGGEIIDSLFEEWGFVAKLNTRTKIQELRIKCQQLFNHDIFFVGDEEKEVSTIGVVSGAGKPYAHHLEEMHSKGVELFVTGESSESVPHKMKEEGIAYFAGGHYATEVFGVQALAQALQLKLPSEIETQFIDIPNII